MKKRHSAEQVVGDCPEALVDRLVLGQAGVLRDRIHAEQRPSHRANPLDHAAVDAADLGFALGLDRAGDRHHVGRVVPGR